MDRNLHPSVVCLRVCVFVTLRRFVHIQVESLLLCS